VGIVGDRWVRGWLPGMLSHGPPHNQGTQKRGEGGLDELGKGRNIRRL